MITEAELWSRWEAKRPIRLSGLIDLHDGQKRVKRESKRFNVLACGRRWGKTRLGVYLALEVVTSANKFIGWFAPTYKYLMEAFDEVRVTLQESGVLESSNRTEKIIRLTNGSLIEFWTMDDPDAGRSRKYHRAIIDEAAKQKGLKGIFEKAIRPTLADFVGDAFFLSSPNGRREFFYEAFQRGQSADDKWSDWASWQMPTSTNPYILQSEIDEAEKTSLPTVFRQEWLAEFIQPAGAVYDCFDSRVEGPGVENTNVILRSSVDLTDTKRWRLHFGLDFGSANTAAAALYEDLDNPGNYVIGGSYHAAGDDETLHVQRLRKLGKEYSAWGGAPSENAWRKRFAIAGMAVARPPVVGKGDVEAQIAIVYRLIRERRLKICSDLISLITEFLSYCYKLDGDDRLTNLIEDKQHFHRLDAVRYVVVALDVSRLGDMRKDAGPKITLTPVD